MDNFYSSFTGLGNQRIEDIGLWAFILVELVSLTAAFTFSALYSYFFAKRATGSNVHKAFPLLALSITMIFLTIQFSLPLSLGLLGALSIVRFRTPIKEPEEIGFIMLVIASSLSCATFNLVFPVVLAVTAFCALAIMEKLSLINKWKIGGGMLVVRGKKGDNATAQLESLRQEIQRLIPNGSLHSLSIEDEINMSISFNKSPKLNLDEIVTTMTTNFPHFHFNLLVSRA
jgi:hypothetical protein